MEFQLIPSLGLLLFLLVLLVSKLRHRDRALNLKYPLPPGPWKLPVIGSAHHMAGGHPHRVLCNLSKRYGDVMELKVGEIDLVVISSPEAAMEVMSTNDLNFASRPELVISKMCNGFAGNLGMALAPYGDHWRQLRKMCSLELLSSKRVKSLSWLREDETSKLVRHISSSCDSPPINLSEKFLALSNAVVFRAVLDESGRRQERLTSALVDLVKSSSIFGFVELFPSVELLPVLTGVKDRLARKLRNVEAILDEIISERQEGGSNETRNVEATFLDVFLRILEQGDLEVPLNINNIKVLAFELLTGGTDATAGIMEWTMAELMRNPQVMEKAQAEVRSVLGAGKEEVVHEQYSDLDGLIYLKMVIKEALRLHAPVPLLVPRICSETCQVSGYSIVAGRKIVVNAWAMGRDPRYWDDAESFKPERFNGGGGGGGVEFKGSSFQFVPFGAGRRMCPGFGFGLALVELVLAQLLLYFDWELPDGRLPQDLDITEAFATTVYLKSDLLLLARPRPTPTPNDHLINSGG